MFLTIKNGCVNIFDDKTNREILKNVNLEIKRGKFISIIGHSGCGKTTLLRVIAGLQNLTSGNILFSKDVKKVGWVPQASSLLPNKTIYDNIILPLTIKNISYSSDAVELIQKYGLKNYSDNYPNEISGGMKQKVSIIRALVTKPNLLLMDEPFASIDQYTREILNVDLANKLRGENITTVLITHSIEEAVFLSDEILIMKPKIPSSIFKRMKIALPNIRTRELKNDKQYIKYVSELRESLFSLSKNYYEEE